MCRPSCTGLIRFLRAAAQVKTCSAAFPWAAQPETVNLNPGTWFLGGAQSNQLLEQWSRDMDEEIQPGLFSLGLQLSVTSPSTAGRKYSVSEFPGDFISVWFCFDDSTMCVLFAES